MEQMAMKIVSMSITASWVIVAVLIVRLLFKRIPKICSYFLWFIVLFRLLCPVTVESKMSLLPVNFRSLTVGSTFVPEYSMNPMQGYVFVWTLIWVAGMLVFFFCQLILGLRLFRKVATAVRTEDGVYETDRIRGAFAAGFLKPRIYIDSAITGDARTYILAHERVHIRRRDYLIKLVGFLALMLHWFNPLAWAAVVCMCSDMEMACDEQVVKKLGMEYRQIYSKTLLQLSESHSGFLLPPAFGESHTKNRIRNILKFRKTRGWILAAAALVVIAAAITLMTNPAGKSSSIAIIGGADGPTSIFMAGKGDVHLEDIEMKEIKKNYAAESEIPQQVEYEEYRDGVWWSGILYALGDPEEIPAVGLYQQSYVGYLTEREN